MLKKMIITAMIAAGPILAQQTDSTKTDDTQTEQESSFSFGAELGTNSAYVSEGVKFGENPTLEGNVNASILGFTATLCNNYSPKDRYVNEWEFILEHDQKLFDLLNLNTGASYLIYPGTEEPKGLELFSGIDLDFPVTPNFSVTKDVINKGLYASLSFEGATKIYTDLNIQVAAGIGYNDRYFRETTGWSHVETRVSLEMLLETDLKAMIGATQIMSDPDNSITYGSLRLRYEF